MIALAERLSPRRLRGRLTFVVRESGVIVARVDQENLILTAMGDAVTHCLGGSGAKVITQFGIGSSGTAPAIGDAALTGAVVVALVAVTYPLTGTVSFRWTIHRGVGTGLSVREFGLVSADGILVARTTRAASIYLGASTSLDGTWTLNY